MQCPSNEFILLKGCFDFLLENKTISNKEMISCRANSLTPSLTKDAAYEKLSLTCVAL